MSRLDSMRRRLTAQIDGLNWAAAAISDTPGDVLELGLGNGRTYDHLREALPDRRIRVIDRVCNAHPSCIPPATDFLQGEAAKMLARLASEGVRLALAHYELGHGDKPVDVADALGLSPLIAALMVPGGIVVSQEPLAGLREVRGPDSVAPERYLFYRA